VSKDTVAFIPTCFTNFTSFTSIVDIVADEAIICLAIIATPISDSATLCNWVAESEMGLKIIDIQWVEAGLTLLCTWMTNWRKGCHAPSLLSATHPYQTSKSFRYCIHNLVFVSFWIYYVVSFPSTQMRANSMVLGF
jgi:hypothetical protein